MFKKTAVSKYDCGLNKNKGIKMENKFEGVRGLFVKKREGSPDFVISEIGFRVDEFKQYLDTHNKNGYVNVDILLSKANKLYAKLNDFEPKKKETTVQEKFDENDSLPF